MFREKTIRKERYPDAEPALIVDQSKDRRGLPRRLGSAHFIDVKSEEKKEVMLKQKGPKACQFVYCDYCEE